MDGRACEQRNGRADLGAAGRHSFGRRSSTALRSEASASGVFALGGNNNSATVTGDGSFATAFGGENNAATVTGDNSIATANGARNNTVTGDNSNAFAGPGGSITATVTGDGLTADAPGFGNTVTVPPPAP